MKRYTLPIVLSSIVALTVGTQKVMAETPEDGLKAATVELMIAHKNFNQQLWIATSDKLHDAGEAIRTGYENTTEWVRSGVERTGEAIRTGYENTTEWVRSGVERTGEAIRTGYDNTTEWVRSGVERTGEAIRTGYDNVRSGVKRAGENIILGIQNTYERTEEMLQQGWKQLGGYYIKFSDAVQDGYMYVQAQVQDKVCRFKVNMRATQYAFQQLGKIPDEQILRFNQCMEEQNEWAKLVSRHDHVIGQDLKCYGVLAVPNAEKIYDTLTEAFNERLKAFNTYCTGNNVVMDAAVSAAAVAAPTATNVVATTGVVPIAYCPRKDLGVDNGVSCATRCQEWNMSSSDYWNGCELPSPYFISRASDSHCICNPVSDDFNYGSQLSLKPSSNTNKVQQVIGADAKTTTTTGGTVTNAVSTDVPTVKPELEPVAPAKPKIGDSCSVQYSTAAQYINIGGGEIRCAATACQPGSYLVKNEQGVSQGWCKWGTDPLVLEQQRRDELNAQIGTIEPFSARRVESVGLNTLPTLELKPQKEVAHFQDSLLEMSNRDMRRQERQEARQERREERQEKKDARNLEQQIADDAKGEMAISTEEKQQLIEQNIPKLNYL